MARKRTLREDIVRELAAAIVTAAQARRQMQQCAAAAAEQSAAALRLGRVVGLEGEAALNEALTDDTYGLRTACDALQRGEATP